MALGTKLKALRGGIKEGGKRTLPPEDVVEIIRAYRRGVSLERIGQAIGRSRGNVYAIVGTWALRHASLPEPVAPGGEGKGRKHRIFPVRLPAEASRG